MSKRTPIHSVYRPLYLNEDKFIVLVTGGRGSGKSFEVARFISRFSLQDIPRKILFTRYTMTSADKSVVPEVKEKIDMDGTSSLFRASGNRITNILGSEIIFMGIKTSSGDQTAKLKSIHGVSVFVCDEAEEWRSREEFDKLVLSLRTKGVQNMVIIVMNPTDTNHFVYEKYIKDTHKLVDYDGVPVQISTHPNVLHIHTTYKDNIQYLDDNFIREAEELKEKDPDKYARVIMGRWADRNEGVIFKNIQIVDSIPEYAKKRAIGLDFGFTNDPTAGVMCAMHENTIFLDELFYRTHMTSGDIIRELREYEEVVIADSADPRLIKEIHNGGINIVSVYKGAGSVLAGIDKMSEMIIAITRRSKNILYESNSYVWQVDRDGRQVNVPVDANNHALDAARYYVLHEILGRKKKRIGLKGVV